ncbi:GNAT family N-acetyltransferase [Caulobacter sp. SLTY]|uniref:GNAT family N-acetyltransferase n=1 Tax=Caulobacter sp. SLTY TaxID=2683262 RepID=UPI001411D030|nr:GNAT family N-acetyltransferase [Caulobacter sp. SLTY]NBB14484.1 GNAT family N-acetyltransferase [Caulobacter sp. SLTY]
MGDTGFTIRLAESGADYEGFGAVCRLYVDWCRERYADMPWFVEEVFGYQALDEELKVLAVKYGPPNGRTMVVEMDGRIVAGGALRRLSDGVCELKRLYVGDAARGLGLGRKLSEALIALARQEGYGLMRLDTGDRLVEAISMYESMGFSHIAPYQEYPERLMPHLVSMEMAL